MTIPITILGALLAGGLASAQPAATGSPTGSPTAASPLAAAADAGGPPASGRVGSVTVEGVPDTFESVREEVARASASSGRAYRVFVTRGSGRSSAAGVALDELVARLSSQDVPESSRFDPDRDIGILLDVEGRGLAMRVPWSLETQDGLDPLVIRQELVEKVFKPRAAAGDAAGGLRDLVAATESWIRDRRDAATARREAARIFRTRTLPIAAAAAAGLVGLGAVLLRRMRHDRRLHEARGRLAAFKQEVVALSDLLDAEQERHRMLPHADADFATPMRGLTRASYDGVQQAIRRYRERWLSLMDVWERAQERIDAEWFLGTSRAEEAIALLETADARPPLAEVEGECRLPLDALEHAHERARALADELAGECRSVEQRAATLAGRGRSAAPFQQPILKVRRALESARASGDGEAHCEIEADPVAAHGRLEAARNQLGDILDRIEGVEEMDDRARRAEAESERIAARIREKKAEGWLLTEPGADPQSLLDDVAGHLATARSLLDAGEGDSAAAQVAESERLAGEADAMLESVVAARRRIDELLPGTRSRLGSLDQSYASARAALEHLAQRYASASWEDVSDNLEKAEEGRSRVARLLDTTEQAIRPDVQHPFRGLAALEEAVRQQEWVEGCLAAIEDRRRELDATAASLPSRVERAATRTAEVIGILARQKTDRVRANEHASEAQGLLKAVADGLAAGRPDPRRLAGLLDAAERGTERSAELAAEDDRLARQAADELAETEAIIRRVSAWYEEGISADVSAAVSRCRQAASLLERRRYEDSIHEASEAASLARQAYAAATATASRRRQERLDAARRRQLEESFARVNRGAGPWVVRLPTGGLAGPDPWRTLRPPTAPGSRVGSSRRAGGTRTVSADWSDRTVQVDW
jgi:hypothetical protein